MVVFTLGAWSRGPSFLKITNTLSHLPSTTLISTEWSPHNKRQINFVINTSPKKYKSMNLKTSTSTENQYESHRQNNGPSLFRQFPLNIIIFLGTESRQTCLIGCTATTPSKVPSATTSGRTKTTPRRRQRQEGDRCLFPLGASWHSCGGLENNKALWNWPFLVLHPH